MEFKIKRILAIQKIPKVLASSIDGRPLFLFTYNLFIIIIIITIICWVFIQKKWFTTSY